MSAMPGSHPYPALVRGVHWLTLLLIGMHSAAALYHHFWRRDGVMRRMLPSLGT
jgi:cytochrome b561